MVYGVKKDEKDKNSKTIFEYSQGMKVEKFQQLLYILRKTIEGY